MSFMSQEEFEMHLKELDKAALANMITREEGFGSKSKVYYDLPDICKSNDEEVPELAKRAFKVEEDEVQESLVGEKESFANSSNEYISSKKGAKSLADFEVKLAEANQIAIEAFKKSRSTTTTKLIEIAKSHPECRKDILRSRSIIDKELVRVRGVINEFVDELALQITNWLSGSIDKIKGVFVSAAKSVVKVFSFIFEAKA